MVIFKKFGFFKSRVVNISLNVLCKILPAGGKNYQFVIKSMRET